MVPASESGSTRVRTAKLRCSRGDCVIGDVDFAAHFLRKGMVADVFHHADHFGPHWGEALLGDVFHLDFPADGALAGPNGVGQQIVHQDNAAAIGAILGIEETALQKFGAHGAQIAGRNGAVIGQESRGLLFGHPFGAIGAVPIRIIVEREMRYRAHRGDAGKRGKFRFPLLDEIDSRLASVRGQIDLEGQQALRLESRLHGLDFPEGADHEAGADQQNQAEADFADDEDGSHAAAQGGARSAAGFAQGDVEIGLGRFDAGSQGAKQD